MQYALPNKPVSKSKRAKMVATIGPATEDYEQIYELARSGVNAFRLNFSHNSHEFHHRAIKNIRKASSAYGKPIAVIQDLQGPKIRLGDFDGIYYADKGQGIRLRYKADFDREGVLPTQYDLSQKVKRGERILFNDGKLQAVITSVKDGIVHVRTDNEGILLAKKGINLPDTDFDGDILTTKDKQDIVFGVTEDVDYVALSFVQSSQDVKHLKRTLANLGSNAKVIAKIETRAAVENIDTIVEEADALLVARGDLAIEMSVEEVPIAQRAIVRLGILHAKPVIIATQMLASMVDAPQPTRAEASDVATAVLMGADAVMLSEETAIGKHSLEAVKVMKRIIQHTEENMHEKAVLHWREEGHTRQTAISKAIIKLATDVNAIAIVPETKSGATARIIASYRPELPIIAVTNSEKVAQQLALVYGVKSYARKEEQQQASRLVEWLRRKKIFNKGDVVIIASGEHPGVVGATDTIKVRILE